MGGMLPVLTAGLVSILGAVILTGWVTRTERLIQLAPIFAPTQFNTALLFLLSGAGLLALTQSRPKAAVLLGVLIATISGLTLLQYLFGFNFYIDELFVEAYITTQTSHPGRMAPNTALCFFLTALFLISSAQHHNLTSGHLVEEALGFAILALASVPIAGYLVGVETAYGWGNLTRMAPQTALAFEFLGIGMVAHTWQVRSQLTVEIPLWIPALIALAVLLADLYTPLGAAVGVAYIPLIFCGLWFTRPYAPFVLASFSSILIVLGLFASPEPVTSVEAVFLNRTMSVLAIWVTAVLVYIHKKSERKLATAHATLAGLIDTSCDGFWDWRIAESREEMSAGFWRALGYGSDQSGEAVEDWCDLAFEEDLDVWRKEVKEHLFSRGETILSVPIRYRHLDNSVVVLLRRGNVVEWDDEHKPIRLVGTHTDVTSLFEAQHALEQSQQRLQLATESGEIGVWEWNLVSGDIIWDDRMYSLYGLARADQAFGYDNWKACVHPDDIEGVEAHLQSALEGKAAYHPKFRITLSNGDVRFLEARGDVERVAGGKPVRMFGVCWDTTEQKEAELKLEALIEELTSTNTELERFAYVASHDLREPLRMITSFTSLISQRYSDKLDDDGKSYIRFVVDGADRMLELIEDLLEYARLGQEAEQIVAVDIEHVLSLVCENLGEAINETGAVITHDSLPVVKGNVIRISRLLQNIIGNALKYQVQGKTPEVHISAERDGNEWIFAVADNGIGISKEYCQQIFQPFKRLHGKKEYSGTGIGLAICKKIIEGHNGRIWVESVLGEGSNFKFTIPA